MDFKILLITIVFVGLAIAGLLIRILIRPGSEFPRSLCGVKRRDAIDGDEKCEVCDLKNTEWCPSDISADKKWESIDYKILSFFIEENEKKSLYLKHSSVE